MAPVIVFAMLTVVIGLLALFRIWGVREEPISIGQVGTGTPAAAEGHPALATRDATSFRVGAQRMRRRRKRITKPTVTQRSPTPWEHKTPATRLTSGAARHGRKI